MPVLRRAAAALLLTALVSQGCAASVPDPPMTVTVGRTPLLADSTVAIATANGWFEEMDLDVEVVEGRNIAELVPLLLAGDIDVLLGGISPPIAEQIATGSGVRMVAGGLVLDPEDCPSYAVVTLPGASSDLSDPDALLTTRIGGPFEGGYLGLWYLERLAGRADVDVADLDTRHVTTADAPATLASGAVDVLLAAEPGLTRIQQELGAEVVGRVDDVLPGTLLTATYFGPDLLAEPELAARYLAVHLRTVEQHLLGATEENVALLATSTGLDPDVLRAVCWGALDPRSTVHEQAVAEAFDTASRLGLLDSIPTPEQTWDHRVGERARALLEEWRASGTD